MKVFVFFGLRSIENWFFNTNICFFGLRPIENWFFNESLCFFGLRPIENGFFKESVCFFLVSGLLKVDFSMRVFVFLVSGLLKMDFSMRVFVFWFQAYWKLIFDESLCFFGLRHCGRRRCTLFSYEFLLFLRPELLQWNFCFLFEHYWKCIFQWESFFSNLKGLLKIVFSMRVFAFWCQAHLKCFLNDSVCGFGLRHCGRRCCALFSFEFSNVLGHELFF